MTISLMSGRRPLAAAVLLSLALAASACGGSDSDSSVPSDAVAVVDGTDVPQTKLTHLMSQAEQNYKKQKLKFPKKGTPEYEQLQAQAVAQLVQITDREVGADREDVSV